MSERKAYKTTRPDIEWVSGYRVQEGEPVLLTDAQAAPELARGQIEPVVEDKPKKAKSAPESGA